MDQPGFPAALSSLTDYADAGGREWLGSAMVYEFESRAALDDFFRDEPYCTNGIYQRIDIYDWRRGDMETA